MNIDLKIRKELESESEEIDGILSEDQGVFSLVRGSYRNGLGRWMAVVYVVIFVVSGLMAWSGYEFFVSAASQDARIFWGFCFAFTLMAQIALKQWAWMEMNRSSVLREIKRLEISVARLGAKIEG